MRWSAFGMLLVVAGCGDNLRVDPVIGTGLLAYADRDGQLVMFDLDTGRLETYVPPVGAAGALSVRPDGGAVTFSVSPREGERHLFVLDRERRTVREVTPGFGNNWPGYRWGTGGYFVYSSLEGGPGWWVALDGATEARRLGEYAPRAVILDDDEPRLAFTECAEPPVQGVCSERLVVESAAGGDGVVVATGVQVDPVGFAPDGSLVATEKVGDALHLTVHAIATGSPPRDLGVIDWIPVSGARTDVARVLDPTGTEVLARRDGELVAIALRDGATRTIPRADSDFGSVNHAEFTPWGTVVYRAGRYTPDQPPEFAFYVADTVAATRIGADLSCSTLATLSISGQLGEWSCDDRRAVFSLEDGRRVAELPGGSTALGFDRLDEGLIVATFVDDDHFEVAHLGLGGASTPLAETGFEGAYPAFVQWRPYAYAP